MKRPVAARASFSATSTASEPPVVKSTFSRPPGAIAASFSRERDRRLAGEAARREGELVHLPRDRRLEPRMAVADVMDVVAVEIHVAAGRPASSIQMPSALDDGVEARRRDGLMQEGARIALEEGAPARVEILRFANGRDDR